MPTPLEAPVDFLLVAPMDIERDALLEHLPTHQTANRGGRLYYTSAIQASSPSRDGWYTIAVLPLPDIGQEVAAADTTNAIIEWSPRYVLLVGNAGGNADKPISLGDVLIADRVVCHDIKKETDAGVIPRPRTHEVDRELLAAARDFKRHWETDHSQKRLGKIPLVFFGVIATSNTVYQRSTLPKFFEFWPSLIGVEMEAGGVAMAASRSSREPGFFMVRSASDLADGASLHMRNDEVEHWRRHASDVAARFTVAFLKTAPVDFVPAPRHVLDDVPTALTDASSPPQAWAVNSPLQTVRPSITTPAEPSHIPSGVSSVRRSSRAWLVALILVLLSAALTLLVLYAIRPNGPSNAQSLSEADYRELLAKGDDHTVLDRLPRTLDPDKASDRPFVEIRAEAYLLKARQLRQRKDLDGAIQTFGSAENDARTSGAPAALRATIYEERAATLLERDKPGDKEAAESDFEAARQWRAR